MSTSDHSEISQLISKLSSATGPSCLLDREIADVLTGRRCGEPLSCEWNAIVESRPTATMDGARKLVDRGRFPFLILVDCPTSHFARIGVFDTHDGIARTVTFEGYAETLETALCIAALRARAVDEAAP